MSASWRGAEKDTRQGLCLQVQGFEDVEAQGPGLGFDVFSISEWTPFFADLAPGLGATPPICRTSKAQTVAQAKLKPQEKAHRLSPNHVIPQHLSSKTLRFESRLPSLHSEPFQPFCCLGRVGLRDRTRFCLTWGAPKSPS